MAQIKGTTVKSAPSKPAPSKPAPSKPAPAPKQEPAPKPTPAPAKPSTPPPAPAKAVTTSNSAAMAERKMNEEANKIVNTPAPKPVVAPPPPVVAPKPVAPPPPPAPKPIVTPPVASKSVADAKEVIMNKDVDKPTVVKTPDPVKVVVPTPAPTPVQTPVASKSVADAKEAAMNKDVDKPVVAKTPDPVKVTVPPTVSTPVAPVSVNNAKEAALTKELDKSTQAVVTPGKPSTLFDTMIDTITKKTDQINTVLTTVIANQPDPAILNNNKAADDAKKLKDSDIVGSINTNTGGLPVGNNVITKTPAGYVVKPVGTPLKQTGDVGGISSQVTASNTAELLAAQQKIEYDRFGKTISDLRKEAQAIGVNGIDYIISQNLGTMTKANFVENTKNYIISSYNQVLKGNYSPDDVTLLGTSIQVLAGVFGADFMTDLRDLSADIINFKPTGDHLLQTGLDAMGLIPLIGAGKYADEVTTLIKKADDYAKAVDEPITILKKADVVPDVTKVVEGVGNLAQKFRNISDDILDVMEASGGHTLAKHVSQTNEELIKRAFQEGVDASTFINKRVAIDAVKESLRKNTESIAVWLANPESGRKAFTTFHNNAIGKGVKAGKNTVIEGIQESTIVLVKDTTQEFGFNILTCFPKDR